MASHQASIEKTPPAEADSKTPCQNTATVLGLGGLMKYDSFKPLSRDRGQL